MLNAGSDSAYVRFDTANQWPYQQEVPNHYILGAGSGFQDLHYTRGAQATATALIPVDFNKKGPLTRSKSVKKVTHKRKLRKSVNQLDVLKKFFKGNPKPGRDSVTQLAEATGLKFLEVRNWFRNARLRNKDDMSSGGFDIKDTEELVGFGEVSSSTHCAAAVNLSEEMLRIWDKVEEKEKMDLVPKLFDYWDRNSNDRNDAIKQILKCLSPQERSFVQNYVKPRGPYRCSGDNSLSKTTILERAKNAWRELERIFGANKRVDKNVQEVYHQDHMCLDLNLDKDMMEGLKSLFQAHRDYLYYLAKEMGIDTTDEKLEIDKLKGSSIGSRSYGIPEQGHHLPDLIPQHNTIGSHMDLFPAYAAPNLQVGVVAPGSAYGSGYNPAGAGYGPLVPAAPTPIYPNSCTDYIPYSCYNNTAAAAAHHYTPTSPIQNMMVGGLPPGPTAPFARSPWLPGPVGHPADDRAALKSYYNTEPDYGFVKNHFSPEKISAPHQGDPGKALIKPFSELGTIGFNYNNMSCNNNSLDTNTESITQKCTFVKYYEVTYNNKSGGQGNTSQTSAHCLGSHLPLPAPLTQDKLYPLPNSKLEQLYPSSNSKLEQLN